MFAGTIVLGGREAGEGGEGGQGWIDGFLDGWMGGRS